MMNKIIHKEKNVTISASSGKKMGEVIIEIVNLMYNDRTALRYLQSLDQVIKSEINKRLGK